MRYQIEHPTFVSYVVTSGAHVVVQTSEALKWLRGVHRSELGRICYYRHWTLTIESDCGQYIDDAHNSAENYERHSTSLPCETRRGFTDLEVSEWKPHIDGSGIRERLRHHSLATYDADGWPIWRVEPV